MEPGRIDTPPVPFAVRRRFRRGALIVRTGTPALGLYLLRAGVVRVFLLRETGKETTTALLGPGHLVGISVLLGHPEHHAFAEARTAVEAWWLPADRLREQLRQDVALFDLVCSALGHHLALTESLMRSVALLPVAERMPEVQPPLEACLGSERCHLTCQLLADLVATSRETLSRVTSPGGRRWSSEQGPDG